MQTTIFVNDDSMPVAVKEAVVGVLPRFIETADDLRAERLLSATYPLSDHVDAIAHAATAGRRGAVKIAFEIDR